MGKKAYKETRHQESEGIETSAVTSKDFIFWDYWKKFYYVSRNARQASIVELEPKRTSRSKSTT